MKILLVALMTAGLLSAPISVRENVEVSTPLSATADAELTPPCDPWYIQYQISVAGWGTTCARKGQKYDVDITDMDLCSTWKGYYIVADYGCTIDNAICDATNGSTSGCLELSATSDGGIAFQLWGLNENGVPMEFIVVDFPGCF